MGKEHTTITIYKKDKEYLKKLKEKKEVTGLDVITERIVKAIKHYGWEKEIE